MEPALLKAKMENVKIWKKHIEAWKKSGLTQSAYSREHNLSKDAFFYWKEKFKSKSSPVSFVELSVSSPTSKSNASKIKKSETHSGKAGGF